MEVVCLGILVADLFADPIDALPEAGQLKVTDRFLLSAGGCATNTAACLRRLGRTVKVLGKVGVDLFGDFVLEDLERLGIDASNINRSKTHPTSGTCIVNIKGEDRRYIHCLGANADFSLSDVDLSALDDARVLYVGGYMAMPGFGPGDLIGLFQAAKDRSMTTVLDVVVPAGTAVTLEKWKPILDLTDVFLPNDDEAQAITNHSDPATQAKILVDLSPNCTVVITQGPDGCCARQGSEFIQIPAYRVGSVDESGAGDAFAAGFLTGMLEEWTLERTLQFAGVVGASCTRALGCHAGVFNFDEALAFLAEQSSPN